MPSCPVCRAPLGKKITRTPVIDTFIDGVVRQLDGSVQENRARVRQERELMTLLFALITIILVYHTYGSRSCISTFLKLHPLYLRVCPAPPLPDPP